MKPKVMIVDDDQDVLQSTEMLVRLFGYEPICVSDATEVVSTARRERPGILLQDVRMYGLDLARVVSNLRSSPETASVPVVLFSANDDLPSVAARLDVWGYLRKPFAPSALEEILEQALRIRPNEGDAARRELLAKDARAIFHDYWNLLGAAGTYADVLDRSPSRNPGQQNARRGLHEALRALGTKTDALRAYVEAFLVALGGIEKDSTDGEDPESNRRHEPSGTLRHA